MGETDAIYPSWICPDVVEDDSFFVASGGSRILQVKAAVVSENRRSTFQIAKQFDADQGESTAYTVVECGQRVIYAGDNRGCLSVFSRGTGRKIRDSSVSTAGITCICRSEEEIMVGLDDGTAVLFDANSLKWLMTFDGYHEHRLSVVSHVHGSIFLTADAHKIGLWDFNLDPRHRLVKKMEHKSEGSIRSALVCPNRTISVVSVSAKGAACVEAFSYDTSESIRCHNITWPNVHIDYACIVPVPVEGEIARSIPSVNVMFGGQLLPPKVVHPHSSMKTRSAESPLVLLQHLTNYTTHYMLQTCDFKGQRNFIERNFSQKNIVCCGVGTNAVCFGLRSGIVGLSTAQCLPRREQSNASVSRDYSLVEQYASSSTPDAKRPSATGSSKVHEALVISRFNTDILVAGKTKDFENIKRVLREMKHLKVWPTTFTYDLAIRACLSDGNIDAAVWLARDMRAMGLKIEERTACNMFRSYKVSEVPMSNRTFAPQSMLSEIVKSGVHPTGDVRQSYIIALANVGQLTAAVMDLKEALKTGSIIRPDADFFVTLLKACRTKTRFHLIESLLALVELARSEFTIELYEHSIAAFAKIRCPEKGLLVLRKMIVQFGLRKSIDSCCQLIVAFGSRGKFEGAKELYTYVCGNGHSKSRRVIGAFMRACVSTQKVDELMSIFRDAASRNVLPDKDVDTFAEVLDSLGTMRFCNEASEIIDTLQSKGLEIGSSPHLLSLLVMALVAGDMMAEALQLFLSIGDKCNNASGIGLTLSRLVAEVGHRKDVLQLHQIAKPIENILKHTVDSEAHIWASLINAYVGCDQARHAEVTYKKMLRSGVKCTRQGYNGIMRAYAMLQQPEDVWVCIEKVQTHHGGLHRDTFHAIIASYNILNDVSMGIKYTQLLVDLDIVSQKRAVRVLSDQWYTAVLSSRNAERPSREEILANRAQLREQGHVETNLAAVNYSPDTVEHEIYLLISKLINTRQLEHTHRLIARFGMLAPLRPELFHQLARVYLKEGRLDDCIWALSNLNAVEFAHSGSVVATLILQLCKCNNYEDATHMTKDYMRVGGPVMNFRKVLHALLRTVQKGHNDHPIGLYDSFVNRGLVANEQTIGHLLESLLRYGDLTDACKVWQNFRKVHGMGRIPPSSLLVLFDALLKEASKKQNKSEEVMKYLRAAGKVATDLERDNHPISFERASALHQFSFALK